MARHTEDMSTVQKWGEALPKGWYHVRADKVTEGMSSTNNPVVNINWKVQEEPYVGRIIFDNPSLQPHALAKLKAIYEAVDYLPGPEGHDPEEITGRECYVYADQEVYEGVVRNKITPTGYRGLSRGKPAAA